MANISLREYIRKIENLIDNGQVDQAIGHCKHILQIYPKHIDSYRLLGKALLEKQKYGDASDIFQRVLSSVPDDFISHIGMSIIREDENNLDAAIWHMERAFEVQPSNKAVQDELRRLYTSRDGVAPPKIRLTRGALVRMYTRGELYNQAIAEIWAALSEDPNRVDLEVVLARIYFLLGKKVEATETCSKLIGKLPYCYEANKILTEILPGTTREEDEKIFRQRVVDMDPYFQFVNEKILATGDVPDSNIMMDLLDWDPGVIVDDQPDWAQSIGFALDNEKSTSGDLSNWFDDAVSQPKETMDAESGDETEPFSPEDKPLEVVDSDQPQDEMIDIAFPSEGDEKDNDIPAWIKDAGWEVSDEEDKDLEKGFTIPSILPLEDQISSSEGDNLNIDLGENDENEEDIQPAEIPGWLQEIAPSETSINIPEEADEFEVKNLEDLFDSLEKDKSDFNRSEAAISWENEFTDDKESSLEDTLQGFDFTSISINDDEPDIALGSANELVSEQKLDDELDWIKDLSMDDQLEEKDEFSTSLIFENVSETEEEEINIQSLDQIINELEDVEIIGNEPMPSMNEDWLNSLVFDESSEDSQKEFNEEIEKEGIPDWIKSVIDEESEQTPFETVEGQDSLPDWLSNPNEKTDNELDEIKISFDVVKDQSIPVDSTLDFDEFDETDEKSLVEEPLSELIDGELLSSTEEVKSEDIVREMEFSAFEDEKFEETFEEIQPIIDSEEASISQIEDQILEDLVPELEYTTREDENLETFVEADQPAIDDDDEEEEEEEDELESALAWMEGLALKHGADEETLLSKPEDRSEIPPEWISEESKLIQEVSEDLDTTPSWLKELEIETDGIQIQETAQTLEEISSTDYQDPLEGKQVEFSSNLDYDTDKVHGFENLFEELENEDVEKQAASLDKEVISEITGSIGDLQEIYAEEPLSDTETFVLEPQENFEEIISEDEIDAVESQLELKELEIDELESQKLISELSIEDDLSPEEDEELLMIHPEEVVISEEISEADDQKFGVIDEISQSEDQLIVPIEEIEDSFIEKQEISSEIEEEIEDTQPVKVKDTRLDKLETANKYLDSGNLEEAINLFDPLIRDGFELDKIIENIQNALDHHFPIDINLWQALGDAHLKNNQLQNALDAYSKAEDLLL